MTYLISLLPVIIYVAVIKGLDGFSLARWDKLTECLVWGMVSCTLCFMTCSYSLVEELAKEIPLVVAIHRKRSAFLSEAIIYGAAIGAGFALLENILYVALSDYFTVGDAIVRGFGTSMLHIGCTALFASTAMLLSRLTGRWKTVAAASVSVAAVIPSFALHWLYNRFILPEYIQMAIVLILVQILVLIIFGIDEKLISRWLDMCISNDISLLQSIRKGKLRETNAGQYLMSAKERFQPEVYFDICVYMGLYLEMSVAAKSRMIMREAGVCSPLGKEEKDANHRKITELANLRKNIGKSGLLFLSPLVNYKAVDKWVISELL